MTDLPASNEADAPTAPAQGARVAPRTAVKLVGKLRERGHTALEVEVHDLSERGFQVDSVYRMHPDTMVWLQVAGLAPLAARVRWFRQHRVGCMFEEPLHVAVYDRIIASAVPR